MRRLEGYIIWLCVYVVVHAWLWYGEEGQEHEQD